MPEDIPRARPRRRPRTLTGLLLLILIAPGCAPEVEGMGKVADGQPPVNQRQKAHIEALQKKAASSR